MKTESAVKAKILKRHFEKAKKANRAFSLRALADKVGVSHAFLSRVLNGKSKAPDALIMKLIAALKIDPVDQANLQPQPMRTVGDVASGDYENFPETHLKVMRKWWNLALLDLLTCELPTKLTEENIHLFLPVPKSEIQSSIRELESLGLIAVKDGRLSKTAQNLRIASRGPNPSTKAFYEQTLTLAKDQLKKTSAEDYVNRTIVGFTCAVDRKNIPLVKQKLVAALRDCVLTLADGTCDDVFLVQAQMFSVLK